MWNEERHILEEKQQRFTRTPNIVGPTVTLVLSILLAGFLLAVLLKGMSQP